MEQQAPVWARRGSFPEKPETGVFGYKDPKGKIFPADSLEELASLISESKDGVDLVWSPEGSRMVVPEELSGLRTTLVQRRVKWARGDVEDGKRTSLLMLAALLWSLYAAFSKSQGNWDVIVQSVAVAVTAIMLLTFGLIPWYEGWKELRKPQKRDADYWEKEIQEARFDTWITSRRTPVTLLLLALMVLTGLAQCYLSGGFEWANASLHKIALLKKTTPGGDAIWRYFTAAMNHGNLVHWLMNFASLRYLARRVEVLARWPQLVIVFVISAFVGGMTTVFFMPNVPSVGASGGILGLLGFLLVFETLHRNLVPKSARKRLLAGLVLVAVMGVLGFSFIDNAAHAGGLIAGMVYAGIVFPVNRSVNRPEILRQDLISGGVAVVILLASTAYSLRLLLAA